MTGVAEADYYTCALPFLITSLRAALLSPLAHAGVVQLAPWASAAATLNVEVAALRAAQLRGGDGAANVSVVTAVDKGDPGGPIGSIHPRAKQPVGARLAAAFLTGVYGVPTPFAGPRFASGAAGGGAPGALSATLRFAPAAAPLALVAPTGVGPLANSSECPPTVPADLCCGFMLQSDAGAWAPADAALADGGDALVLTAPGAGRAVAAASGWCLWPITRLYSADGLPAFPFNASFA
jgi:hypothetical protein